MLRYTDFRLDASTIQQLPDGSLKVVGQLTQPGVFTYANPDGSPRKEYRPPEEVFKASAMATFAGVTLTINHPRQPDGGRLVTSKSWKKDAIGHVGDNVRQDGGHMVADLYIRDESAVRAVLAGQMKHISCGYKVDFDATPGVTPDGQRIDGVQRNMRGNHVALLPNGVAPRGGAECVLRLDSNGDELKSGGMELEAALAKVAALEGELKSARTDAADVPALRTKLTKATADLAAAEALLGEAGKPERLDALVEERTAVVAAAKTNGIDPVGKSTLAVKRLIVAKRTPKLADRVDSYDGVALDAVMAVYAEQPHASLAGAVAVLGADVNARTDGADATRTDAGALPKHAEMYTTATKKLHDAWKNDGCVTREGNIR